MDQDLADKIAQLQKEHADKMKKFNEVMDGKNVGEDARYAGRLSDLDRNKDARMNMADKDLQAKLNELARRAEQAAKVRRRHVTQAGGARAMPGILHARRLPPRDPCRVGVLATPSLALIAPALG